MIGLYNHSNCMLLGHQTVISILSQDLKRSNVKHVKGIFSTKRDYAIVCRLYFWYKINGKNYEKAVEKLSEEFYLGETTIAQIIMRERETLELLKSKEADRKYLQNKLPHYNWSII